MKIWRYELTMTDEIADILFIMLLDRKTKIYSFQLHKLT